MLISVKADLAGFVWKANIPNSQKACGGSQDAAKCLAWVCSCVLLGKANIKC